MGECLGSEYPDCGLAAVQRAAQKRSIVVDYDVSPESPKLAGQGSIDLLELVSATKLESSGIYDVVEFGCLACDRCILFEDDDADLYVDGELMSSTLGE